jgi:spore coat protein W
MSDADKVTKSLSDLIITDTFLKHGITDDKRRNLTDDQKQQIRDLVEDLKQQVDQFVKNSTAVTATAAQAPKQLPSRSEPAAPKADVTTPTLLISGRKKRPRLTLRKKK